MTSLIFENVIVFYNGKKENECTLHMSEEKTIKTLRLTS